MGKAFRYLLQALNLGVFALIIGYFSTSPSHINLEEGKAVVTLAFGHAGELVEPCRERTPEELAQLAPNMRTPMICTRERSPIIVELLMDGEPLLKITANPPGAFKDQGVDIYQHVEVPAGPHSFRVNLSDHAQVQGHTYTGQKDIDLAPAQLLLIDFNPQMGGFLFK